MGRNLSLEDLFFSAVGEAELRYGAATTFADRLPRKCTLGQMIGKYMVLIASEQRLLMMRPYQICAVKAIVDCIDQNCGNGYVWHTTGSGKTLTSFKARRSSRPTRTSTSACSVVDRKALDRQTREEFNRFQEKLRRGKHQHRGRSFAASCLTMRWTSMGASRPRLRNARQTIGPMVRLGT